jgi:hypothetical protein
MKGGSMFWTVEHPVFGPATLCERCALKAVNNVTAERAPMEKPFGSMNEALVIIHALAALYEVDPLEIESSEVGYCEHCAQISA